MKRACRIVTAFLFALLCLSVEMWALRLCGWLNVWTAALCAMWMAADLGLRRKIDMTA